MIAMTLARVIPLAAQFPITASVIGRLKAPVKRLLDPHDDRVIGLLAYLCNPVQREREVWTMI